MLARSMASKKCARCPAYIAGKCKGSPTKNFGRRLATEAPSPSQRRIDKREGDISSAFTTFSGKKSAPLPPRFRELKQLIVNGNEAAIQKSWDDLIEVLKVKTEEVATKREKIIPVATFEDVQAGTVPDAVRKSVKDTGVVVIRGVMPRDETEALHKSVREYFEANPSFRGFPADADRKVVYESYWSAAQVRARSHPNMLATQQFVMGMYHAHPDQRVDLTTPLTYADRVQLRPPGDTKFALSPHVDGGGIERWEDPSYRHTYRKILSGEWPEYDPWDMSGRLEANMNLYNSGGGCSVFRAFQGWLGLSTHGPQQGTLVVHPILKESTAYWLLRPFFKPTVKGSLDGWKLSLDDEDGNVFFHGSTPGGMQEHNPDNHPHLHLEKTMIPYPTVDPGDTVFWSADTIHGTEMKNTGTRDASVFYIPSVPLTDSNIQYVAQQRDAFLRGVPPPDFPGGAGESLYPGRARTTDLLSQEGKRAMGLEPFLLHKQDGVARDLRKYANTQLGYI